MYMVYACVICVDIRSTIFLPQCCKVEGVLMTFIIIISSHQSGRISSCTQSGSYQNLVDQKMGEKDAKEIYWRLL